MYKPWSCLYSKNVINKNNNVNFKEYFSVSFPNIVNYYILGRRRRGNLTTTKTTFVEKSTGIADEENERNKIVHEKEMVLLTKKERNLDLDQERLNREIRLADMKLETEKLLQLKLKRELNLPVDETS